jgi:hypothetical protein
MLMGRRLGIAAVNATQVARIINDPRGPEEVIPNLSPADLARLVDAPYRNLDTPSPELGADLWYQLCVEESDRRAAAPATNG